MNVYHGRIQLDGAQDCEIDVVAFNYKSAFSKIVDQLILEGDVVDNNDVFDVLSISVTRTVENVFL